MRKQVLECVCRFYAGLDYTNGDTMIDFAIIEVIAHPGEAGALGVVSV